MEFIEALNDLIEETSELKKKRDGYKGYEFSYHHYDSISRVEKAEVRFNKALDDKIMQAIKNNKDENA